MILFTTINDTFYTSAIPSNLTLDLSVAPLYKAKS